MMPATEETYAGKGGVTIFYRSWLPAGAPRAIVLLSHGFNAHSGQYAWVAGECVKAGFAVYAGDLRGRGQSEGPRFYVDSFDEYVADLSGVANIARSRHPGLKLFVLGHSAGGVVATIYTLDNPDKVAGLICESFAYRVPAPEFALDFITFLSRFMPKTGALTLSNAFFSRDPEVVKALNADPLIANETQPFKTVGEMWKADRRLQVSFGQIRTPTLILHGTADKATSYPGSEEFYRNSSAIDKTLKLYKGHYHDLLADIGKAQVMAEVISWVDTRV